VIADSNSLEATATLMKTSSHGCTTMPRWREIIATSEVMKIICKSLGL